MPTTKDIAPNTLGLVFSLLLLFGFFQADAQCDSTAGGYSLSIELLYENIGVVGDNGSSTDLSGFNTYRVYLECEDPADKLSAIEGNDNRPLNVSSTTGFYQTSLFSGSANALPNFISPILYSSFPEIVYDSWVTIGIEETADSEANETEVKLTEDASNPLSSGFASGNDLIINSATGSAWYIQDSDNYSNGLAGANSKVLVAQLTTDGQISGQLGMQVFRNGISTTENCVRPYLSFQSHGCMESSACNYAPTAIIDDGSCDFCSCPDSIQVLSASFPNDSVPAFSLEVEIIADHDTTGINTNFSGTSDPLAGMKTYRVYAQVDNASTLVTAGFGGTTAPLSISSTEPFYQSQLGGTTPSNNSASLFDISPYKDLRYDSWVTIGIDRTPSQMPESSSGLNYAEVSVAGSWPGEFNNGGGLYASGAVGGTWFAFPSTANVLPDENLRVLIAQFTTAGTVSGTLGLQIVPETAPSDSTNDYRLPFSFTTDGLGDYTPIFPEICSCENVDNDYLCDDVDPCVGSEDACGICNGPGEIYECGCADIPAGDCDCDGNQADAIGVCGGACTNDDDNNGVCDDSEILGCMDDSASNYDDTATQDNGSCFYNGCTDPNASNYDDTADTNDGSCIYPGCTDPNAWNYDPGANQNDGSCQANACGVDGVLVEVTNYAFTPSSVSIPVGGTVVWQNNSSSLHNVNGDIDSQTETSFGNPEAFGLPNSVGNAQGTCMGAVTFNVPGQYQYDCSIGIHAALGMVAFITVGDGGCTDVTATNYDSSADYDNGSCTFAGCTDSSACNYDSNASSNDGSCVFVDGICETCEGGTIVDNDADNDGVCDGDETTGCTDSAACNYDADPTTDTDNGL
ncbi:MAG: plastocyanin/azurin family copper-binding protein, partial [Flavobacteriales bacterium]|nr:plastocyanin/azurin family copper-binding protein [Flavobacteriales bacterium]